MKKIILLWGILSAAPPLAAQVPTPTPTATPSGSCCQGLAQINVFLAPAGMAVDYPNKRLYVADFNNQQVQVFNSDTQSPLTVLTSANSGTTFINPIDVSVDGTGDFFVADVGAPQPLKEFSSSFAFLGSIGPAGVTAYGVLSDASSVYFSTPTGQMFHYN